MKLVNVEFLFDNGTSRKPFSLKYLNREIKELISEIYKLNWNGIVEELDDVYVFFMLWLYTKFGLNLLMLETSSVKKYMGRFEIWKKMFKLEGVNFEPEVLIGGSNYSRSEKIINAFLEAGHKIDSNRAKWLLEQVAK